MTENKETKEKQTTKQSSGFFSGILNILAFIAVCIGGVALFLAMLLNKFGMTARWIGTMSAIANAIGWFALCLISTKYIKHRRKLSIWIIWIVAVVMIISGIVVPLF